MKKYICTIVVCITLLFLSIYFSLNIGIGDFMTDFIMWELRLPRIFTAISVGTALAASGSILQSITQNPLAEPGLIGINSGAALAVVLLISFRQTYYHSTLAGSTLFFMPLAAIIGAFLAALMIYTCSYKKGISMSRLLLVGIGVNAALNAFITLYQLNMSKGDYNQALTWISGSLWGSSWEFILISFPIIFILSAITFYKCRTLDILDLGDSMAVTLGVSLEKERRKFLFLAVALAATATAIAGNIAFIGILGPQIAKTFTGSAHQKQLPVSALISSIIIILADTASRNLFPPLEIPVGITISVLGVPYFVYLMTRTQTI